MANTDGAFPGLPGLIDKQFWQRPEGKFGIFVLGALALCTGVGVLIYLPAVLAYIATITASMLSIALHGVGLFAIIYAFFIDDNLRNILGHGYRSIMRNISGLIIKMDPISIVKDYVKMLRTRMTKMEVAIKNLKTSIASLDQLISTQETEIADSMKRMAAAKRLKGASVLTGQKEGQLAALREKSNANLKKLKIKMELVYRVLLKMHEAADYSISVTDQKVDIAVREATAMTQANIATQEAMKVINGDPARKEWFDRAMGELAQETVRVVAEIDNFMNMSKSFFETVDLDKAVNDETAMEMLEQWEADLDGGKLLGGGAKAAIVNDANNPNVTLDLDAVPAPRTITQGSTDVKSYFDS